ncbi:MAG TPA: thiolase family protein [Acidimicrobiales bacterium]|nr:thiolase family protein [Acidimicrobiales bacterium]
MSRKNEIRRKVLLAGVGYSEIGRSTGRSEGSLALEASRNAIADSGLAADSIDGIAVWPDRVSSVFEGPSIAYMQRALGMKETRYWQAFGSGPAQLSSVVGAIHAIASGAAETVLCYRAHLRQEQRFYVAGSTGTGGRLASGDLAFKAPYGVPAGSPRFALWAQRHAHEYGTTDEHRGALVLTCREHAQLNPRAVWNGTPLTMDDYLAADLIASPLRIVDCDMPVDGAVTLIFTAADRAPDLRAAPVYVESLGHATGPTLDFDLWPDVTHMGAKYAGDEMWAGTDLGPGDIDVAQIYDGFSTLAISWLEDLGFTNKGEAGDWLVEGRGKLGGDMPICTDGGQLGAGRLHGFGKVAETAQQLRGECGERQVPGAEVALTCAGGGPLATSMILTR